MTIQPLFNPLGQQVGQMLVTRHCCIPDCRHTDKKTSTVVRQKPRADTVLTNLYVKEKCFLNLYCKAGNPRR